MIKFGKAVPATVVDRMPELIDALSRDRRLDALWLFGSRARGEADALSDVDLAALAQADASSDDLWNLQSECTSRAVELLGTDEVSVQLVNRLPLAQRHAVLRDARLLWARVPERVADFEAATIRHYLDFKPYLDAYDRDLLRQAAAGKLR